MILNYIDGFDPRAMAVYWYFKKKDGSEETAPLLALDALCKILDEIRPKRVLEVGAGIGTVSYLVLKFSDAELVTFEDDPWCIAQLARNLKEFKNRYELKTDFSEYDLKYDSYDLLVVDGGSLNFLESLAGSVNVKRIFFVGWQFAERKLLRKKLGRTRLISLRHHLVSYCANEIICEKKGNRLSRFFNYYWQEFLNAAIVDVRRFFQPYRYSRAQTSERREEFLTLLLEVEGDGTKKNDHVTASEN